MFDHHWRARGKPRQITPYWLQTTTREIYALLWAKHFEQRKARIKQEIGIEITELLEHPEEEDDEELPHRAKTELDTYHKQRSDMDTKPLERAS